MYCTSCGNQIGDAARFCSACGTPAGGGEAAPSGVAGSRVAEGGKRLSRIREGKKLAGVCGGVARYFEIDPTLVRVLWLLIVLAAGTGVLAYVVCWIVMPIDPEMPPVAVSYPAAQRS